MEVRYRREMNHNYMILDAPEATDGYECRMLAGNTIEGLLKFRLRYGEEKQEFYYEITSRQPLSRVYEKRKASGEEIKGILFTVLAVVGRIEAYLLTEDRILLDPDYIYVEPDRFTVELCLLPGYQGNWPAALSELLKFLLEKADHSDRDGVILAYNLYQESLKENYGSADLLKHLSDREDTIFEKTEEPKPNQEVESEWCDPSAEPETEWMQEKQKEPEIPKQSVFLDLLKCIFLLAAAEGLLWYQTGRSGLRQYGAILLGIGLLFVLFRFFLKSKKNGSKGIGQMHTIIMQEEGNPVPEITSEQTSWKLRTEREEVYQSRVQKQFEEEMKKSREEGTVLLTGKEVKGGIGRFEPISRDKPVIEIGYVPFVIGKHPQLSDYCLDCPTVSRLHLRIDKKENVCIITDLNSTNGTAVNQYHLQSNETVSIKTGDVIYLADQGFCFYENGKVSVP